MFVDTPEAAAAFDAPTYFDTDPALVGRAFNRPTKAALSSSSASASGGVSDGRRARKRSAKLRDGAYAELEDRIDRSAKMRKLGEQMAMERELLKKGRRTKVAGGEDGAAPVYKWKSQRKR